MSDTSTDNNVHLRRLSPFTVISFFMFILSWCYIIKALTINRVKWPTTPDAPPSVSTYVLCAFLGLSLVRLYLSLWRVEEDKSLALKLCPIEQGRCGKFFSFLELGLRIAALAFMFTLTSKLTNTDYFIVFNRESDFCSLLISVFATLVIWDLVAMPRLFHRASETDKFYFILMIVADALSCILAFLYSWRIHVGDKQWAQNFLFIFGGIILVVFIFETFVSKEKLRELGRQKYWWVFPKQ